MNDTIPPLARKIVSWLEAGDTQRWYTTKQKEAEVAHLISTHVPIDAMVAERTAYRDALWRIVALGDRDRTEGTCHSIYIGEIAETALIAMGESRLDPAPRP